jgi:hypothetical protein
LHFKNLSIVANHIGLKHLSLSHIYIFCQKDPIITIFFSPKLMYLICWKISLLLLSRIATRTVSNVSVTYICFILYVPCKLYLDDNCTLFGAEIYDFLNCITQGLEENQTGETGRASIVNFFLLLHPDQIICPYPAAIH